MTSNRQRLRDARGTALLEFSLVVPLVLVLCLGVVEVSYALLDQHVVTKLTREGSNLISRNTSLLDAANALRNMSTRPVNFNSSARVILSVAKNVNTAGAVNFGRDVLYQRYEYGAFAASSALQTAGTAAFGGAPDFQAANADNDVNLRLTNLPPNLIGAGGLMYITEIYSRHQLITPFDRFGIQVPDTLYSIAYF
jgi:Flp pilus assembly protein TadG